MKVGFRKIEYQSGLIKREGKIDIENMQVKKIKPTELPQVPSKTSS